MHGDSGLHLASEKGHVAVVGSLVDAGADVNAANVRSPDTLVILHGQCCRMCLPQQGGWVGARCVDACCTVCVGLLCGAGAGQADGTTPIMYASRDGHVAVVAALVSRGANVSARTVRS
jgi:ankyrin repeat protein